MFYQHINCLLFISLVICLNMAKKKMCITISPKINDVLENGGFNKSKLISKLLQEYIKKQL